MQSKVVRTVKSAKAKPSDGQGSSLGEGVNAEEKRLAQTLKAESSSGESEPNQQATLYSNEETPEVNDALDNEINQNTELSAQSNKFHVVKDGENLYRISLLYNIRMATLQKWNNLENTGAIIAGQKLWLVPPNMQEE
jgi:type IV pilus assembly protein PilF